MRIQLGGSRGLSGARRGGKIVGTIFGLVFLLAGLAFTGLIASEAWKVLETWTSWKEVSCEILTASASTDGDAESPYEFHVSYRYSFGGKSFTGRAFRTSGGGFDEYRPVQLLLLHDPPGSRHSCWVDPIRPENAVLKRNSPLFALLIFFPMIFVAIGATVLVVTWKRAPDPTHVDELGRRRMSPASKRRVLQFVFLVLILGGAGGLYLMKTWIMGPIEAKSWLRVPATVIESHLRRHESTDSDGHTSVTWKIDILYEYEVQGRTYRSNRYGFIGGSSSGRDPKERILRRYPPGAHIEVFVDPSDPTSAVIEPGWTLEHLLILIPLLVLLIGLFAFSRVTRSRTTPLVPGEAGMRGDTSTGESGELFPGGIRDPAQQGPVVLSPSGGRWLKVVGLLLFSLFWNGIVSIFVYQVVAGFQKGHPDWIETIFMVPFVVVGLGVLVFFVYSLLATANPKTIVTLEEAAGYLGEEMVLNWQIKGSLSRLADFRIVLTGSESATYRRGTTSHTDTEVFMRIPIFQSGGGALSPEGRATIEIPPDTMHSFAAPNNKIVWKLEIHADVPRWPDVSDSWEVQILPARYTGGQA